MTDEEKPTTIPRSSYEFIPKLMGKKVIIRLSLRRSTSNRDGREIQPI